MAGPPVSVTEPASTPISAGCPSATREERADDILKYRGQRGDRKEESTSGPPTRSSAKLAPKPTDVKNAIISGVCSVVSKRDDGHAAARREAEDAATSSPPMTGAGMLYRASSGTAA